MCFVSSFYFLLYSTFNLILLLKKLLLRGKLYLIKMEGFLPGEALIYRKLKKFERLNEDDKDEIEAVNMNHRV